MADPPEAPVFDLQSHSLRSDGQLEPVDVVASASAAGVELLALTDHDTVDGVAEALEEAKRQGIALVPAVELSVVDGLSEDFHILGYHLDHTSPALLATLAAYREDRAARGDRMIDALAELGFGLDLAALEKRRGAGLPIGRPHLAAAAVAANRERLAPEGLDEMTAFLKAYLIPGRPAYRGRTTPTVAGAIETIHAAGGVAVWAHPFWDLDDPGDVLATLRRFAAAGLDGVEAFYVTHDRDQTRLLAATAAELGLLTTGSADFHGPDHRLFSRFRAFDLHGHQPSLGSIGSGAARQ